MLSNENSGRPQSRRRFLKSTAAAISSVYAVSGINPLFASVRQKPNIVLIYVDDLDFDEIGVYDPVEFPCRTGAHQLGFTEWREPWRHYPDVRMLTPHIDSLARDGARFDRFYVTTAICTPSRYSLLTGRHASTSPGFLRRTPAGTLANIQWNTPLNADEFHLPGALKQAGYRTGIVGKWHLGDPVGRLQGVDADADARQPEVAEKVKAFYRAGQRYLTTEMGFDSAERLYMRNKESMGLPKGLQHHNLEWIIEGAVDFIERNREQPFFLYAALPVPHSQYDAIYGEFSGADPLATPAGFLDQAPDVMPSRQSIYERLAEKGIDRRNAMATWIDDGIGAMLKKLHELQLSHNTLVLFISDHQSRGKYSCYEGARVPCLMRWPGVIGSGRRIDALAANIDILPTLLDSTGLGTEGRKMHGKSLMPVLTEKTDGNTFRHSILLECAYTRAVVTERFKFIANRPPQQVLERMKKDRQEYTRTGERRTIGWDGRVNPHDWGEVGIRYVADVDFPAYFDADQFYDLGSDPFEQVNLILNPLYREEIERHRRALSGHLQQLPHRFGEFTD